MRHHRTKTLALAAAIACTLGGAAVAQTTGTTPGAGTTTGTPGATTTRTDDRGFNWGWLGLLGLAGLAGLTGRNRTTHNSTLNR
ncbi:WGxxGxxG family protein [Roseomonas harenae]|uniref:WGxxGxxG family protein n=1 Tax=Muricoccus harenae TaxID=2692566 RepID=UPI0019154831